MNVENTSKLFERFKFFHPERDIRVSLMAFGFECGNGWFKLVWNLCEKIEKILIKEKREDFEVHQVKEKFGELRFYTSSASDKIHKLICKAESKSRHTCEECGKRGKSVTIRGWIFTLCKKCLKAYIKKREEREKQYDKSTNT